MNLPNKLTVLRVFNDFQFFVVFMIHTFWQNGELESILHLH